MELSTGTSLPITQMVRQHVRFRQGASDLSEIMVAHGMVLPFLGCPLLLLHRADTNRATASWFVFEIIHHGEAETDHWINASL